MNVKVKGYSSIGPARVMIEDQADRMRQTIAEITIPDEDLADVVAVLLTRCFQQNIGSDNLRECVTFAAEVFGEKMTTG